MSKFMPWDPAQLPDLTGFIAIVTGGNTGLGLATATELALRHATVYIASRSAQKSEEAIAVLRERQPATAGKVHFLEMDLMDLESVRRGVERFLEKESKLHILVNNAGIMCAPYGETKEGFEVQFAVNYISHFLLTQLLLPTLLSTVSASASGTVRIINVSSDGHAKLVPKQGIVFDDINLKSVSTWTRYGQSKLANVLHAKELARRYGTQGLWAASLHPGTVKTNLSAGPRASTPLYRLIQPLVELGAPGPEKGAYTTLYCAASRDVMIDDNGAYFTPVGKKTRASERGEDPELAKMLWEWTEEKLRGCGY